jgi:hypothetical protein
MSYATEYKELSTRKTTQWEIQYRDFDDYFRVAEEYRDEPTVCWVSDSIFGGSGVYDITRETAIKSFEVRVAGRPDLRWRLLYNNEVIVQNMESDEEFIKDREAREQERAREHEVFMAAMDADEPTEEQHAYLVAQKLDPASIRRAKCWSFFKATAGTAFWLLVVLQLPFLIITEVFS